MAVGHDEVISDEPQPAQAAAGSATRRWSVCDQPEPVSTRSWGQEMLVYVSASASTHLLSAEAGLAWLSMQDCPPCASTASVCEAWRRHNGDEIDPQDMAFLLEGLTSVGLVQEIAH